MPIRVGLQFIEKWNSSLEKEVCRYEEEEIVKGQIIFYGPSNFTRWSQRYHHIPLREAVVGKSGTPCCINRGFGSSCAEHQLYYYPRMVRPLAPKVLVYSGFGNYLSFGYSEEEIWELGQRVVTYAMTDFPGIHVYLCGLQRHRDDTEKTLERWEKVAGLLRDFASQNPDCHYLDLYHVPTLARKDIFVDDGVHYNQEGYHLYADYFREALKEELALY